MAVLVQCRLVQGKTGWVHCMGITSRRCNIVSGRGVRCAQGIAALKSFEDVEEVEDVGVAWRVD
jgi:hypothetical protein